MTLQSKISLKKMTTFSRHCCWRPPPHPTFLFHSQGIFPFTQRETLPEAMVDLDSEDIVTDEMPRLSFELLLDFKHLCPEYERAADPACTD